MPKCAIPISQREITISRSVIRDVVKDLIKKWGIPSDTSIIFNELQGAVKLEGGIWKPCAPPVKTDYNNFIFVEYEESFLQVGEARDTVSRDNHLHIFQDKRLGVFVRPIFANMKVEMTLKIRTRDLTSTTRLRNALKFNSTEKALMNKHDVWYDYNLDNDILFLFSKVHELKENVQGDSEDLKTYLKSKLREGVTSRSNQIGHAVPIVQECQRDCLGVVRESLPFNVIEVTEGIYEVTVPYEFHYQQPSVVEVSFPLFIHNQYIGDDVINIFDPMLNVSDIRESWHPLEYIGGEFKDSERYYRGDGGSRLVPHDDWYPEQPFPNTQTLCLFPIMVEDHAPRKVVSLLDLPDGVLSKEVKDYLIEFNSLQAKPHASLIIVEVIEQYDIERSLDFTIDTTLNITTHANLIPKHRNYVRVSILKDWSLCTNESLASIMKQPEACLSLAKLIDNKVTLYHAKGSREVEKDNALVVRRGAITKQSMRRWLLSLPYVNAAFKRAPSGFMRTVMMNNTIARRN